MATKKQSTKDAALAFPTQRKPVGKVIGLPTMLRPEDVPLGATLYVAIRGVTWSKKYRAQNSRILSLESLVPEHNGRIFSFPCQKGLEVRLFPGAAEDEETLTPTVNIDGEEIDLTGLAIAITKGEKLQSKNYKGKTFSVYEVALLSADDIVELGINEPSPIE